MHPTSSGNNTPTAQHNAEPKPSSHGIIPHWCSCPCLLTQNKSACLFFHYLFIYYFCFYLVVDRDNKQAMVGRGTVGGAMITWSNVSQPTETNGRPEVSVFNQNYNGNVIKKTMVTQDFI